jgi:formate-dependent nitrite reductase cytochrome c552 subunit
VAAFLALALPLGLVAAMAYPGDQLGALPPLRAVAAQAGVCADCHNPGRFADGEPSLVAGPLPGCGDCHSAQQAALLAVPAIPHIQVNCVTCHEGADAGAGSHLLTATATSMGTPPRVNFNQEVCEGCHLDQYNTFEIVSRGRTFYGGSDGGPHPPKGWSKTVDLPYWNVLIDGHPFVLETYEDSPMAVNQIEHQETIRPGSEACMECHGTRAAFMMGIEYRDKNGAIHSVPAQKTTVTLPNGTVMDIPAKEYVVRSTPSNRTDGHLIYDGTSYQDSLTGEWKEAVNAIMIPVGTKVWTYTDGVNLAGGDYPQKYQVKTVVTLPAAVTVDVLDKNGAVVGTVTFDTIASYPEAGADINGMTGITLNPTDPQAGNVATVARNWIYAALEALAFDGLDHAFDDPMGQTHFTGAGYNWPSVESGELCNQCHDPHTNKLRIVKKSLIAAIAERGINPYSPTGRNILTFEQASRQDQIIAVCGQCHSEYVGGYSANTKLDQDYFPWAKPADLETQYQSLFGYLQDWTHGKPINPWQSDDANARGFLPYDQSYPIDAPLVKVQHPEAETFFNSTMYNAGATCTDCHSARITRFDGTVYTSHWFTSPLKLMDGFTGVTATGQPAVVLPQNPCAKCHIGDTIAQSQQRIKTVQDNFNFVQERTQVALVNALKYISEQKALGVVDQSANITTYQRAALRWEYYAQAENSMSFHNNLEATTEVANARIWVDGFIPWPLTPVKVRLTAADLSTLTLTFYDQANNETGFKIERAPALAGPYVLAADIPTPNGANMGDVAWTDTVLASGTTYYYRVSASSVAGVSVPSIWATGATQGVVIAAPSGLMATAFSSGQIDLAWTDNSGTDETGFRVERANDAAFTVGFAAFDVAAAPTTFSDTGLTPGTTYYYRVFAVGANAVSAPSETAPATTQAAVIAPARPSGLTATPVSSSRIDLAWTSNSPDATGFRVERAKDVDFTIGFAAFPVAAAPTTFSDTGLTPETLYYYRVFALRGNETSAASDPASATTLPVPPAAPSNLVVKSVGQTTITISWKDNSSNEQGFYVWRKIGAGAWTRLPTLLTTTTYLDTGLARRTSYSYRVQAHNAAGDSAYSNVVTAKTK